MAHVKSTANSRGRFAHARRARLRLSRCCRSRCASCAVSLPRECILDKLIYALVKCMAVIRQHREEVPRLACGDNVYAT